MENEWNSLRNKLARIHRDIGEIDKKTHPKLSLSYVWDYRWADKVIRGLENPYLTVSDVLNSKAGYYHMSDISKQEMMNLAPYITESDMKVLYKMMYPSEKVPDEIDLWQTYMIIHALTDSDVIGFEEYMRKTHKNITYNNI